MADEQQAQAPTPGQFQAETLDLINIEVTGVLTRQADDAAKVEAKAVVLVGYAGALSAFLATIPEATPSRL